ncbi:vacuolar protein sorting-associated protein 28-like protein [Platysternon megacephalum]|uniref:Vacuolar protein sorting-associated protein 28-like protein n=1 Tax=Platysternon megacephalum TaxID=55544 RepID=A0A4D9DWL3_9SAUR|nr:vacuolar protein sorting-associated protein 28-like protein [Platysternon megacephalum]
MGGGYITTLLLLVCISGLIYLLVRRPRSRRSHLPPGPAPLPFLGNALQLKAEGLVNSLRELRDKYGPVFTVHLGPRRVVVLWGYEAVKEALECRADEFSGRGKLAAFEELVQGFGLLFANGERWRQLRRFSLATLQDAGPGKQSVEEQIQEEAQRLVEEFRKTKGSPFDPTFFLSRSASSVICSIVFGQRFDYTDKSFLDFLAKTNQVFVRLSSTWGQLYEMFSCVMRFLPGAHKQIFRDLEDINSFILERIKANQASLDRDNPRDFIDCFLLQMEKEILNPATEFHLRNLVLTAFNLFFVGTETVSSTLRYGLLILLKHPAVEEKMTQEIDRVIGRSRMPAVEDRSRMPYTDAVIHEIQRFSDVIPMNLPHALTRDTHFRGYAIPKQRRFNANEAFMPFSTGKRICLGQELARMELFIFLTAVLQNFTLEPPVPPRDIDLTPRRGGFAHVPPCYQLCALWPGFTFPLILLTACLLFLLWRGHQAGRRSLPPGPCPLPLLGNLPQLPEYPKVTSASPLQLRDKYGPVFTIYLGSQRAVVLWGYEAVKEALVDQAEEFGGREGLALVERTSKGNGLFFSNGETWRQLRRFALTTLRNFGMGKRSIEERIQEEIQYLLEEFRKTEGILALVFSKNWDGPTWVMNCLPLSHDSRLPGIPTSFFLCCYSSWGVAQGKF